MDEVIFEEFKGYGQHGASLGPRTFEQEDFSALDFEKSGTRKEELLYHPDELTKIYSLRRSLKGFRRGSHGDVHPTGSQNQKQPRVPHGTWSLGR